MLRPFRAALVLATAAAIGCRPLDGPDLSLLGTWAVVEFVDRGATSDIEGTAVFTAQGAYSFDVRFRFPGETPLAVRTAGTYEMVGSRVTLHGSGGVSVVYDLYADGDRIIMADGARRNLATRITLRRIAR